MHRPCDMAAAFDHLEGASEVKKSPADATSFNDEELTKPVFENGRYRNPWETWKDVSVIRYFYSVIETKNESNVPSKKVIFMNNVFVLCKCSLFVPNCSL